jgi:aspartyl protease family protein
MFRIHVIALVLMAASLFGVRMIEDSRIGADAVETPPAPQASANARTVVITSENGHFAADARVDGRSIAFMVDTGASQVTLRESEAARLGYRPRASDYTVKIETANGEGRAALVELSRVDVGDITVRDIRALVVPDTALSVNLLGMSFLSRVRWTQERGRLVLEQ